MSESNFSKAYDPKEVEARWYAFWLKEGYFRAEAQSSRPPFSIVLPPPNVTGSLHLGHALTATIQDILVRWKRMSGFNCLWLPGTDHAGIATQMVVERELKKTEKKSRHDLGREEFLKRVWAWKDKYGKRIGEQHQFLGASVDWSRERFTLDEGMSTAVKEVFVRLYNEGLIYRASRLINWCPSCHTALSDLEVDHQEKNGSLWQIAYPVDGSDQKLIVATTRPETMLGDTAVAVHPDDPRYAGLIGKQVRLPLTDRKIPIIGDKILVNMEFGTGVVKVTPGHDFNDYQTGLRHRLPMISLFDDNARTTSEAGRYAGMDRYDARKKVLEDLTEQGLLVKEEPHKLSVGVCDRCQTVVEPRLSPQWWVKIKPLAEPAIAAVEEGKTRFVPETWTNTYFQWMRNIADWCISRQQWWGHRIPAYYCTACTPKRGEGGSAPLDAPVVVSRDKPTRCPKCQGDSFEQDPDVLDTWFSSALWPFATLGWPAETPELNTFYPTSVMETGHDIIFFWVSRMMMMGLHFRNDVPFRDVYLHAMVRDEKGEKMSKTKGNVIDPLDVILGAEAQNLSPTLKNKFPEGMPAFGADALRFTLASLTQQGRDIKLSLDRVSGYKAFVNKLWNASRFALMNMGDFKADDKFVKDRPLTLADRWILARLNRCIKDTQAALEQYQFSEATSTLYQFLWGEFCDWYIELSKGSLYGEDPQAKASTRAVLVFSLDQILRLLHPFMPFVTEEIWQNLPIARTLPSVMISRFPKEDRRLEDAAAEAEMAPVVAAIEGVRNIRGENNLSPQSKIEAHIQSPDAQRRETLEKWRHYMMPLAGLSAVHVGPPGPKPAQSAAYVGQGMEIYVPLAGLLDLGEETARLQKEISKLDSDLANLQKKLENPNFVAKAPPEVVAKDRARIEELLARRLKLQEHSSRIAPEVGMSNDQKSSQTDAPPVASVVQNPETARFKIAQAEEGGSVDLRNELQNDLAAVEPPAAADPTVTDALNKLREGTKEGLSATDHYDLGVAYMGMGLVDDAVREFTKAKGKRAKKSSVKAKPATSGRKVRGSVKKTAAKAKAKPKAKPKPKMKAKPKAKAKPKSKAKAKKPARKAKSRR